MNFLSYLPDFRRKTSFLGTIKGDKQHIYAVCRLLSFPTVENGKHCKTLCQAGNLGTGNSAVTTVTKNTEITIIGDALDSGGIT
ncbi:hypothetical protein MR857_11765, partial [bacterium]|nr:hypothetical protein [bacterium]